MDYNKLRKAELIKKIEELESIEYNEKFIIEQSPDGIVYLDLDNKIIYGNKEFYRMFDIKDKYFILGKEIEHVFTDLKIGGVHNSSKRKLEFSHSEHYFELNMTALKDSENLTFGHIGIIRDITEFKKARILLEQSEINYRNIIENSNDNIIITKDGKLLFINPAVEKTIGYTKKEVIGTNFINYVSKEERMKIQDMHIRRLQGEEIPKTYESCIVDKNGKKIIVELNNNIVDYNGEKCVMSLIRDITERKTNELKKEKSYEDRLKYQKEAMDLALDGIAILSKDKKFIYVNDAYCKMNRYENNTFLLNYDWSILYEKELDEILKKLNGHKNWIGEVRGLRKDKTSYDQELSISVLEDGGFITVIRDISKVKLNEKKLRIAKEQAEESDKLKSAFLANMSHEIRTPINAIKGFADLLHNRKQSRKNVRNMTSIIKRKSEELLRLINDILDLSRIESGQAKKTEEIFSINKIIDDIEATALNRINETGKKIKILTLKSLENNDNIFSDKTKITQILNNLVDNATKFTKEGYIQIGYNISIDKIDFFVKDTGIGIPEDKKDIIFERFTQANDDVTYGGAGLGLTISKKLIDILDGEMKLKSEVGKGSVFTFTIPLRKTNNEVIGNNYENKVEDITKLNWSNKIILYVEDDEDNITLMKEILRPTRCKIIIKRDGIKAEEFYKRFGDNINLVLMDIRLPGQDGIETTKKIKKMNSNVPIIAQTAYAMKGDRERMLIAGCDDYISKPIDESILISKMEYFLQTSIDKNKKVNFFKRIFSLLLK